MTAYDLKAPGRLTYRFAASIASALQATRTDTLYWLARSAAGRLSPRAVLAGLDLAAEDPGELDVLG